MELIAAITVGGILYALLAAVLVYAAGWVLAHLGVPVPLNIVAIIAVLVFLVVLLGDGYA